MSSRLIVTIEHLYTVPTWNGRVGYCGPKSREWFAARGWSWLDFVKNGIDADRLLATDDALAIHLVEHARRVEEEHHGQQ